MATPAHDRPGPFRDALTGLTDARSAAALLAHWARLGSDAGEGTNVHAMLLGMRRFETINRAFGTVAGDAALVGVATRIRAMGAAELDEEWLIARIGGDRFLIAQRNPCSRTRWEWLAEAIADSVSRPMPRIDGGGSLRLWPRIALIRALAGESEAAIIDRLEDTLDELKQSPGRRLQWADSHSATKGRTGAQLETDLLAAIDRNEIEILFQPQFAAANGQLVGAEALARWDHPELGRIGAVTLFTIAERADHVAPLSNHIGRKALAEAADWRTDLRLSLNITAADLAAGSFASDISALLEAQKFAPERLTLEITEQALLGDLEHAAGGLAQLVYRGVQIALDDFGAGFCNFRYLKMLPLHYLKLDRAMVDGIVDDARDLAVFRGIVAMAHALGLKVIAEGIESEPQRQVIAREGCSVWQGFLGARPLSAHQFQLLAG